MSVVTPMYNAARHIEETIQSALAQTHRDVEVLAVDDCSKDDTCEVVARIADRDSRVKLLRHTTNGGPATARNTALAAARGRYIAFLDADDLWLPDKLELQLACMRDTGAGMCYTAYRRIDAQGNVISPVIRVPPSMTYRSACRNTAMMTSTVVVDSDQSGPFRMKQTYYDDYACWLELLRRPMTARAVPLELMRYRVLAGSVSRNKAKSALKVWEVQRNVEGLPLPYALFCFAGYAFNAVKKYYFAR